MNPEERLHPLNTVAFLAAFGPTAGPPLIRIKPDRLAGPVLTRSFMGPSTTLLASRLSNASSAFSCPAAPGSGGKLDRPSSKLGDGGLGGGDWGVALCTETDRNSEPETATSEPF